MPTPTAIHVAEDAPLYDSTDEAASRVLSPLRNARAKLEQGGLLVQLPNGKYAYTSPVDQTENGGRLGITLPQGWKLAGIYHSHLKDNTPDANQFSDTDIDAAKQRGIPSYVLFQNSGQIRSYVPGVTPTTLQPIGNGMGRAAHGDQLNLPEPYAAKAYPAPYDSAVAVPKEQALAQALRTPSEATKE